MAHIRHDNYGTRQPDEYAPNPRCRIRFCVSMSKSMHALTVEVSVGLFLLISEYACSHVDITVNTRKLDAVCFVSDKSDGGALPTWMYKSPVWCRRAIKRKGVTRTTDPVLSPTENKSGSGDGGGKMVVASSSVKYGDSNVCVITIADEASMACMSQEDCALQNMFIWYNLSQRVATEESSMTRLASSQQERGDEEDHRTRRPKRRVSKGGEEEEDEQQDKCVDYTQYMCTMKELCSQVGSERTHRPITEVVRFMANNQHATNSPNRDIRETRHTIDDLFILFMRDTFPGCVKKITTGGRGIIITNPGVAEDTGATPSFGVGTEPPEDCLPYSLDRFVGAGLSRYPRGGEYIDERVRTAG